jgi:hypothetical protein
LSWLFSPGRQRFAFVRLAGFWSGLNPARRCFSSADHEDRWTISRARFRLREARHLACIDSLSPSSRLAIMELAARERAPTTTEARSDGALEYFSPVSQTPGFPACDIHVITTREKDRTL